MTEGQVRYQQLAENQRHNLEMEKIEKQNAQTKQRQVQLEESYEPYRERLTDLQAEVANMEYWKKGFETNKILWADTITGSLKNLGGIIGLFA